MAKPTAVHAHPHMHDLEGHLVAVEEDLEYYRCKRLEPRIIHLIRRGIISFHDLLQASPTTESRHPGAPAATAAEHNTEARIRAVEDALDDYVKGILLVSTVSGENIDIVIEDTRKERGDYDEFFRITKKSHGGSLEERIARLERDLVEYQKVLDAFTGALVRRGIADARELERRREALRRPSAWNGGKIVARAWVEPKFKAELIARGREALRELGIPPGRLGKLGVVENTEAVHNVIVCTLCSCYPYDLLGDTPWWYKHDIYKTRIIADPRGTLAEMFGLEFPPTVEVRVHDSTSDVRYMVIPRRPPDTEGLSEEELAQLVTVDSLIGAGQALRPSELKEARAKASFPRPRDY